MYRLNKVNSYGINFQKANVVFLVKQRNSFEYHPASIKTPKKLHKQSLYTYINIYKGGIKNIIEAMRKV